MAYPPTTPSEPSNIESTNGHGPIDEMATDITAYARQVVELGVDPLDFIAALANVIGQMLAISTASPEQAADILNGTSEVIEVAYKSNLPTAGNA